MSFTIGHGGQPEGESLRWHIWRVIWGLPRMPWTA